MATKRSNEVMPYVNPTSVLLARMRELRELLGERRRQAYHREERTQLERLTAHLGQVEALLVLWH